MIVVLEASNLQPSRIMTVPFCGNVLLSHTDAKLRRLRILNHITHFKLKGGSYTLKHRAQNLHKYLRSSEILRILLKFYAFFTPK